MTLLKISPVAQEGGELLLLDYSRGLQSKAGPSKDAWVHYDNMLSRGTPAREVARGGKWD